MLTKLFFAEYEYIVEKLEDKLPLNIEQNEVHCAWKGYNYTVLSELHL